MRGIERNYKNCDEKEILRKRSYRGSLQNILQNKRKTEKNEIYVYVFVQNRWKRKYAFSDKYYLFNHE